MINNNAIRGLAITTAFFRRGWCPDTQLNECVDDLAEIQSLAVEYLDWAGVSETSVSYADIANAIWGIDKEDAECDPADFPGMTADELKLYEAAE
jgi:hypothetical protein